MKKLSVSLLAILFVGFLSFLNAEDLADSRVSQTELNYEVKPYGSDTAFNKQWEDNRAGKVLEAEKWFLPTSFASCVAPADYACPELVDSKRKENYRSRINFIDLKNGQISCSVLPPLKDKFGFLTFRSEIPMFTTTFTNQTCADLYATSNPQNKDNSDEIKKLIDENKEFNESLQQQEYKYTVDYKYNGDDEFMDLADVLDALVSFNGSKFNLEQSLLTKDLKTNMGYTVLPNETIVGKLEASWGNLLDTLSFGFYQTDAFAQEVQNQAKIRNIAAAVANSSYFMLLDFWLKSNELIVSISQMLAFLFVGYNVIFTWASPVISNKIQKKDSGENSPQRALFGFVMLVMLFSGEVDKVDIEYDSKTDGTVKTELIVEQTNLQSLIQLLYSETNWVADSFAEIGMRAFMNSLNSATGLLSEDQINALATERVILKKAQEKYAQIDKDVCYKLYDVRLIQSNLDAYRLKTLNENEAGGKNVAGIKTNPFPKTEREANEMQKMSKNLVFENTSPYNSVLDSRDSGVVKEEFKNIFRATNISPLTLSGCYYNKKKMIDANARLQAIENELVTKFKSDSQKNAKVEYLKMVNEIQWSLFAKQGYLSIAYLPATAMLIDNIGIVGDYEQQQEALKSNSANSEGFFTDNATGLLQSLAEDIPYLTMFGGYQIAKMIHPVKNFVIDGGVDLLSKGTGPFGRAMTHIGSAYYTGMKFFTTKNESGKDDIDVLDLWLASKIIQNIFTTLIFVTLITGTILIFTLLFIEKLFAFISSMFLLIYAFSKNQEERVGSALAKIFAVAFKTVLIVICVFLSMYSLNLVNSLETIFVESFFKSMDMIENASWAYTGSQILTENVFDTIGTTTTLLSFFFKKYIFIGVTKFAFMMLKLVLIVQMLWKMPGYMYELIYEKVHSVSDSVGETLQSVNESQTMRV